MQRREALQRRAEKERNELSQLHLITSPEELTLALAEIDKTNISTAKKLETQVKIRKKVLHQGINVTFAQCRRQRPLNEIIKDVSLKTHQIFPIRLLWWDKICHKFELEETHEEHWYYGCVIGYDVATKLHEVIYDGEEEHCHFDLTQDLIMGDLKVLEC